MKSSRGPYLEHGREGVASDPNNSRLPFQLNEMLKTLDRQRLRYLTIVIIPSPQTRQYQI